MDKFGLIAVIALAIASFIGSFFIKRISPKILLFIAIAATLTLLIGAILHHDNKYPFILILGLAWIIKCIQAIKGVKNLN